MGHASDIVLCSGPDAPHAFDNVPLIARNGALDAVCPTCRQHGQWNGEIDLVSFRCKRVICDACWGMGWIETGDDAPAVWDIKLDANGQPQWFTRYLPCR
jgi:hypothetical protein